MRCAAGAASLILAGCAAAPHAPPAGEAAPPLYHGVQTRLLDGDLVNFLVEMEGAGSAADVAAYAECAAAQYTLIRGYGFARHLRTNVDEEGGIWRGDAVYTISPALPQGAKTLDAEVVVATCAENEIPTV
ncbi:hypothetical protein [Profundibacterium mesophilum]|uniref:Lipoprotein n=1 Tax=Profundibacterium mesophilum KAUST100406-0324 TaxID=1037889 RepID=A0A921NTH0_9RHOB|nr:hypothetical protein [Profundibacterium mesophilum]KAF0674861.1 lipoprotein [Profundibacterium mesophilum KAUST100406-0324]